MGNVGGRPRAAVSVQLNIAPGQPVLPGMIVAGYVNVTILEPIPDVTAISVSVRKHERTHWEERRTRTRTVGHGDRQRQEVEHYTEYFDGNEWSVACSAALQPQASLLMAAQQSMAFTMQIPANLPPVTQLNSGSTYAWIRYPLFVTIHRAGHRDLDSNTGIFLNVVNMQPPSPPPGRKVQDADLVTCCCVKRGQIHAELDVSCDACLLGEQVQAKAAFTSTPSQREVKIRPAAVVLVAVLRAGYSQKTVRLSARDFSPHTENTVPFGGREYLFTLPMPTEAATFQSNLIKTHCYIEFEANENGCCTGGMDFKHDIRLFYSRAQTVSAQAAPLPAPTAPPVAPPAGYQPTHLVGEQPPAQYNYDPAAAPQPLYFF